MRLLTTSTIEEQIGELDALVDDLYRKPRNPPAIKMVCKVPGGCLIEPVVIDQDVFVGFFTIGGSFSDLTVQLPLASKASTLTIKSIIDNVTHSINFQIGKGQTSIAGPIDLEANSKVYVSLHSESPIQSALFGYIFTPRA